MKQKDMARRLMLITGLSILSGNAFARGGRGGGRGGRGYRGGGGSGKGFLWLLGIGGVIFGLVKVSGWKEARLQAERDTAEKARLAEIDRLKPPKDQWEAMGLCLLCGSPMTMRTAKVGRSRGTQFLGCTSYPRCAGTRKVVKPKAHPTSKPS